MRFLTKRRALTGLICLLTVCVIVVPAGAQSSSTQQPSGRGEQREGQPTLGKGRTELGVFLGAANTVTHFHLPGDHHFATVMLEWGRVVTRRRGAPPPLAGHLEMLVEVLPILVMTQSERAYGAGVMPVLLRWIFDQPERVRPFLDVGGGVLATDRKVPEKTARFNFMAHASAGLRVRVDERRSLLLGYRWHHISNGNLVTSNPGINSHMFYMGVSVLR